MIFVVHDVRGYRRWRPQAAVLGLPMLHGIDAGVARSPHDYSDYEHDNAGSQERKQT